MFVAGGVYVPDSQQVFKISKTWRAGTRTIEQGWTTTTATIVHLVVSGRGEGGGGEDDDDDKTNHNAHQVSSLGPMFLGWYVSRGVRWC
jgi:hypothetical protein